MDGSSTKPRVSWMNCFTAETTTTSFRTFSNTSMQHSWLVFKRFTGNLFTYKHLVSIDLQVLEQFHWGLLMEGWTYSCQTEDLLGVVLAEMLCLDPSQTTGVFEVHWKVRKQDRDTFISRGSMHYSTYGQKIHYSLSVTEWQYQLFGRGCLQKLHQTCKIFFALHLMTMKYWWLTEWLILRLKAAIVAKNVWFANGIIDAK